MKKFILYPIVLATFILLYSCGDILDSGGNSKIFPIDGKTENKPVIQKLNIGNYFKYRLQIWDQEKNIVIITYDDMEILRDSLIDGVLWYTADKEGTTWQANKPDGLHFMEVRDRKTVKEYLRFKYPASVGDTYTADTIFWIVASVDTTIQVAAGKFRCYHYQGIVQGLKGYFENRFYCPEIGFIKQDIIWVMLRREPILISELVEYRIKN